MAASKFLEGSRDQASKCQGARATSRTENLPKTQKPASGLDRLNCYGSFREVRFKKLAIALSEGAVVSREGGSSDFRRYGHNAWFSAFCQLPFALQSMLLDNVLSDCPPSHLDAIHLHRLAQDDL